MSDDVGGVPIEVLKTLFGSHRGGPGPKHDGQGTYSKGQGPSTSSDRFTSTLRDIILGRYGEALQKLTKLGDVSPRVMEVMGLLEFQLQHYENAAGCFSKIRVLNTHEARLAYSYSLSQQGKKDIKAHTEILQPTLEESPLAHNNLGVLYYEAQNYGEAENYFKKAMELQDGVQAFWLNYMRTLRQERKNEELEEQMREFLSRFVDTDEQALYGTLDEPPRAYPIKLESRLESISRNLLLN